MVLNLTDDQALLSCAELSSLDDFARIQFRTFVLALMRVGHAQGPNGGDTAHDLLLRRPQVLAEEDLSVLALTEDSVHVDEELADFLYRARGG